MVSALAEQKDAKGAMAMNSVSYNAGRTVSPILYLFVLLSLGAGAAFAINAATFLVFAVVAAKVYPSETRGAGPPARAELVGHAPGRTQAPPHAPAGHGRGYHHRR